MKHVLATLLTLSSCSATITKVRGPAGEVAYSINCGSEAMFGANRAACFEAAGEACGELGYEVVDASEGSSHHVVVNQYGAFAGSSYHGTLLIKCKPARLQPLEEYNPH